MWSFFLTEMFVLNLCNFNIAENVNMLELSFELNVNTYKISIFKEFENVIFVCKSFLW